jgi:RHS repeat-associated protein
MQSPGSQGTRDASTPEIEEVFSLAADPQLAENSRQGSERKNRAFALGFEELKSQTMQWGSWQASGRTASVPTVYLYDGPNLLEEVDNSGNVLARYTQSGLIDEPLSELRASTPSYYEQDGINVVSSLSNSTGALTNTYTYDSFGKLTASSGTIANPFQYTSREFDPETGLLNYRARYYDPTVGRFLSEDPIGFHAGVNFYDYVLNRPTLFLDPTGLAGGPYGTYEKTRSWGSKIKCAIYLVYCTKNLQETRDSLDQMTDQAVTNTSDAMGNQGSYSNQRLKCGLSQDSNCQKALENCVKLALTNPFPPPSWMKDLMNYFSQPKSTQPAPPPTQP